MAPTRRKSTEERREPRTHSDLQSLLSAFEQRVDSLREAASQANFGVKEDYVAYVTATGDPGADAADLVAALDRCMDSLSFQCEGIVRLIKVCDEVLGARGGGGQSAEEADRGEHDLLSAVPPRRAPANDVAPPGKQSVRGVLDQLPDGSGWRSMRQAEGGDPDRPGPEAAVEPVQIPEGVRLLATQMSAAGESRREIANRLVKEFGVADGDDVVVALFGR